MAMVCMMQSTDILTGYAAEVLADGPALYWRLGETSGTVATDSSGHSHDGTYIGTPGLGTTGLLTGDPDTCLTCSGDDYVQVVYSSWLDASYITVEALIKTTATGTNSIIDRDDGMGIARVFQFRMTGSGNLQFILIGTSTVSVVGSAVINDGAVHHVAATFDGATIKLYVDGVLDGSVSTSVALPTDHAYFRAGANSSAGPVQFWVGQIDEVAYYTSALSAARIAAHAAAR